MKWGVRDLFSAPVTPPDVAPRHKGTEIQQRASGEKKDEKRKRLVILRWRGGLHL